MKAKNWQVICDNTFHYVEFSFDTPEPLLKVALPTLIINGVVREGELSADRRKLRVMISESEVDNVKDVTPPNLYFNSLQNVKGGAQQQNRSGTTDSSPQVRVPDSIANGRFKVVRHDYDYGDLSLLIPSLDKLAECRAAVYLPDSGDACPVVVFLHGSRKFCSDNSFIGWPCSDGVEPVPNYAGYSPIAEVLASHGFAVVSVSANGVMRQTTVTVGYLSLGDLIIAHLDLLNEANSGGRPELSYMEGRLDLQNVGLVGHSWGGEGVARSIALNSILSKNYGLRAAVLLGSSVISRLIVPGVHTLIIHPFHDGQGPWLPGEQYAEISRYAVDDDVLRSSVLLMAENHNFFNTEWSPGAPFGGEDTFGQDRLVHRPAEVQKLGAFYMSGFFRLALGGEQQFLPLFDGSSVIIPVMPRAEARSSAYFPASSRYLVQSFETLYTNDPSSTPGNWDWVVRQGVGEIKTGYPPGYFDQYAYTDDHSYLHLRGANPGAPAELHLRPRLGTSPVDLSLYTQLKFHVAVLWEDNPEGNVEVVLRLGEATSSLGETLRILQPLPERKPGEGLFMHLQITVPLEEFFIDLSRPVDFLSFTLPSGGSIYLSDTVFVTPALGTVRPLQLPLASLMGETLVQATSEEQELEVVVHLSDVSSVRVTMRVDFTLVHRVLGATVFDSTLTIEPGERSGVAKYLVPAGGFTGGIVVGDFTDARVRVRLPTNVIMDRTETRFRIAQAPQA